MPGCNTRIGEGSWNGSRPARMRLASHLHVRTGVGPDRGVQYRRSRSTHSFNDPSSEAGKEA
jgi:hypothetical protein